MTVTATLPTATIFPSDVHRKLLHQRLTSNGWKALTPDEKWHWHAYVYGMRRVLLSDFGHVSPPDENGEWFTAHLVDAAEAHYRRKFGRRLAPKFPPASSDDAVRSIWPQIPLNQLTSAERRLAEPEMNVALSRARQAVAAVQTRAAGRMRA